MQSVIYGKTAAHLVHTRGTLVCRGTQFENHCSNGWLEKFRKRNNISFKSVCGEAASVDEEAVNNWKAKIPEIIANYAECDIFNADETGLFYRVLPDKTMAFKNEICTGGKISKERLTVLLCSNMLGEFERPVVIGKAKRPRAFKKLDINNFPVDWYWNKKAWMTTEIMTEWFMKFDNRMGQNKRKVLLFLDNAAPHPHLKMKNIELVFFPPNMTSHCQPLDQGVIHQFKKLYRTQLLRKAVADLDANSSQPINVLDAIYWVSSSSKNIQPETVKKCFLRSGFRHRNNNVTDVDDLLTPIEELGNLIKVIDNTITENDYITLDDCVETYDADIENSSDTTSMSTQNEEESDEENDGSEDQEIPKIGSLREALLAVKDIRKYISSIEVQNSSLFSNTVQLENALTYEITTPASSKQTKVTDFFQKC
ncbi:tigger transposable element-derived protein 6-like [Melanaphis sacchari]|uniref:tigger transposable element-derived protein 6-like n=1 Tax=Melanaphis sacchari TaxID=742174 RepID=UPI000DC12D2A|nr:tigger transposable element-derived protein 6-like [Melanaphis sacchari]